MPSQTASVPAQVRVLTPLDADAYRPIRLQALHEQPPAFGALPEEEPGLAEIATRLTATKDRTFFGAFHDGKLVGILRCSLYSAPNEKHRAYLAGLYILPELRRQGYGRALVHEALKHAATLPGLRRVNLTVVTVQEAAIRLYDSFGFRIYGTDVEAFTSAGILYDEHLMTLRINHAHVETEASGREPI